MLGVKLNQLRRGMNQSSLLVGDVEVKVCDAAEPLGADDGALEVVDGDVEAVARDGGVLDVVLELEPDRHREEDDSANLSLLSQNTQKRVGLKFRFRCWDKC